MDTPSMSDRKDEAMSERITEVPEPSDAEAINRIAAYMKRNGYETCTIGTNGGVCYRRDNIYDALHAAEQARAEAERRSMCGDEMRATMEHQLAEARRDCKTATTLQEYTASELESARAEAARYREALERITDDSRHDKALIPMDIMYLARQALAPTQPADQGGEAGPVEGEQTLEANREAVMKDAAENTRKLTGKNVIGAPQEAEQGACAAEQEIQGLAELLAQDHIGDATEMVASAMFMLGMKRPPTMPRNPWRAFQRQLRKLAAQAEGGSHD